MQFTISQPALLKCLSLTKIAIPPKATRPILKTFFISAKEGKVLFRATDGNLDISCKVEAEILEEGEICVDNIISDIIPNFSQEDIKFKLGDKLIISQGRRRHTLSCMDKSDFPEKRHVENYQQIEPKVFLSPLKRTSISLSSGPERPILQSYYINPHLNAVFSTDGIRISRYKDVEFQGNITNPDGKMVNSVVGVIQESDQLQISFGSWSGIKGHKEDGLDYEVIFNSRSGTFPEVVVNRFEEYSPDKAKVKVIADKSRLKSILSLCKTYTERAIISGLTPHINMTKNDQGVMITMNVTNLAEVEEHLECDYQGEDGFNIWIQPIMLFEAISQFESDKVELLFFSSQQPFLALDSSCPNFTYLQAAMAPQDRSK